MTAGNKAAFSLRGSFFTAASLRAAAECVYPPWLQASRTGPKARVNFAPRPARCAATRFSRLLVMPV